MRRLRGGHIRRQPKSVRRPNVAKPRRLKTQISTPTDISPSTGASTSSRARPASISHGWRTNRTNARRTL